MRRKNEPRRVTDAELAILRALWRCGPSTVGEVHEIVRAERDVGYTTVLKLMQIMVDKGLLVRDESRRRHVYRPRVSAELTQRRLVRDLLERAFEGSVGKLVMQALSTKKVTPEELAEIRTLLDGMEEPNR